MIEFNHVCIKDCSRNNFQNQFNVGWNLSSYELQLLASFSLLPHCIGLIWTISFLHNLLYILRTIK